MASSSGAQKSTQEEMEHKVHRWVIREMGRGEPWFRNTQRSGLFHLMAREIAPQRTFNILPENMADRMACNWMKQRMEASTEPWFRGDAARSLHQRSELG